MICQACGNHQNEGVECSACHTPFSLQAEKISETESVLQNYKIPQEGDLEMYKQSLGEQAKIILEQEKQILLQQAKMEEEKQRLIELKQNHEKQLQEILKREEETKAIKNEVEIGNAVDKFKNILITSTPVIQNRPILEFKGLIGSQVLIKLDTFESAVSNLKDAAGLRNTPYYENLKKGFSIGLTDLKIEASKLEANAVVGVTVQDHYLTDQVLILSFIGTAVLYQNPLS